MTIQNIRQQIDDIDKEIASLLKARWQLVANISKLKKLAKQEAGYRPFREQDIYDKLPHDKNISRDEYWTIWKEIMTTTVMRENEFEIAVGKIFFREHGFLLAQEFGRSTLWRTNTEASPDKQKRGGKEILTDNKLTDKGALRLLWQRQVGLAVIPMKAVHSFFTFHKELAIVNIFPSFRFAPDKKISNQDILGVIVGWQAMEQIDGKESLLVILNKEKNIFEVISPDKLSGQTVLGRVPRPHYWQDKN